MEGAFSGGCEKQKKDDGYSVLQKRKDLDISARYDKNAG